MLKLLDKHFKKNLDEKIQSIYSVLLSARFDPKNSKNFSGLKVDESVPSVSLDDYINKIGVCGVDYFKVDISQAYKFLLRDCVEVISFHPSCLGNGRGPVSVYVKDNDRRVNFLIENCALYN